MKLFFNNKFAIFMKAFPVIDKFVIALYNHISGRIHVFCVVLSYNFSILLDFVEQT